MSGSKKENDVESTTPVVSQAASVKDEGELVELDDLDSPKCQSNARKWIQVLVICSASACATCFSSVVRGPLPLLLYSR